MAGNDLRSFTDARLLMDRSVKRMHSSRYNAHNEFDRLWMEGLMSRHEAYSLLQYILGITDRTKAHFAYLTVDECNEVIRKLRLSYTIPNFFRFVAKMKYERKRIEYISIASY